MIFKLDIKLTTFLSFSFFSKWEFNHLAPIKKPQLNGLAMESWDSVSVILYPGHSEAELLDLVL